MKRIEFIQFINMQSDVILEKKLITLPINEALLIEKSIEFFNDPEPCMIHRSAVMKRLYIEIGNYIENLLQKNINEIYISSLPDFFKEYLNLPSDSHTMKILYR